MEFEVIAPEVEELVEGDPGSVAVENARRKADAVAGETHDVVVGVDTVVSLDRRMYGKPRDPEEARVTLRALSGRRHVVISGLCLRQGGDVQTGAVTTTVEFRELDERLIDRYVASGEWRGRAGGYAIQGRGAALVTRIEGDYLNVVGLPAALLLNLAPWLLEGWGA